jgi:hypothetical protein
VNSFERLDTIVCDIGQIHRHDNNTHIIYFVYVKKSISMLHPQLPPIMSERYLITNG